MLSGVRGRLTLTIVALVVLTAVVLGVDGLRLRRQPPPRAGRSTRRRDQAGFDLSVLAPGRLDDPPTEAQVQELADAFQRRGLDTIIVPADGDPFYSPATLRGTLETIPADVRRLVDRGQIAYSWQKVGGRPSLVVGGRVVRDRARRSGSSATRARSTRRSASCGSRWSPARSPS